MAGVLSSRRGWSERSCTAVVLLIAAITCLAALPATATAATASWSFEPSSFDFGVLLPGEAAPAPAHLKLVNTGEVALDAELTTLSFAGEFDLAHNNCSGPLAPGASCAVEVTFKPLSSGVKEATLEVFDGNGKAPPAVARLAGTGMSPTAKIDPTAVDFGTIQAGIPGRLQRTVTVFNQGPGELAIHDIEFHEDRPPTRPQSIYWAGGTCGYRTSLPPAGSCSVLLEFGSLEPLSTTGELQIFDNAIDSPQVIHLSGTATPPPPLHPAPPPPAAPLATLSGHPAKRTKARAATFTFSGNEDTTRFECRLDKSAFRRCTSPAHYRSLEPGKHRFWVRPIGSRPTIILGPAVSYSWRVVAPPPIEVSTP